MSVLDAEMKRLDGLFVGMLNDDELKSFELAISMGLARRSYEGAGGFLGLAKVRSILDDVNKDVRERV